MMRTRTFRRILGMPCWALILAAGCQSSPFQNSLSRFSESRDGTLPFDQSSSRKSGNRFAAAKTTGAAGREAGLPGLNAKQTAGADALARAKTAEKAGRLDAARMLYLAALKTDPQNAEAHHRLAIIADRQRDYGTAERHYLAALRQRSSDPDLLSDFAYSHLIQQRYDASERYLKQALSIDPRHTKALYNLGWLYGKQGDHRRAYELFRRAGSEQNARMLMAQLSDDGHSTPPSAVGHQLPSQTASRGDRDSLHAPRPDSDDETNRDLSGLSFAEVRELRRRKKEDGIARRRAREQDTTPDGVSPWQSGRTFGRDSAVPVRGGFGHPENDDPEDGRRFDTTSRRDVLRSNDGLPDNGMTNSNSRRPGSSRGGSRFSAGGRYGDDGRVRNGTQASAGNPHGARTPGRPRYVPDDRLNDAMRRIDEQAERNPDRYQVFPAGGRRGNRAAAPATDDDPTESYSPRSSRRPGNARPADDHLLWPPDGSSADPDRRRSSFRSRSTGDVGRNRDNRDKGYDLGTRDDGRPDQDGGPNRSVSFRRNRYGNGHRPDGDADNAGYPARSRYSPRRGSNGSGTKRAVSVDRRHRDALRMGHNAGTGVMFPLPADEPGASATGVREQRASATGGRIPPERSPAALRRAGNLSDRSRYGSSQHPAPRSGGPPGEDSGRFTAARYASPDGSRSRRSGMPNGYNGSPDDRRYSSRTSGHQPRASFTR